MSALLLPWLVQSLYLYLFKAIRTDESRLSRGIDLSVKDLNLTMSNARILDNNVI